MSRPLVWLVGQDAEPEFEPLVAWLAAHVDFASFATADIVEASFPAPAGTRPPALVVFCSARPQTLTALVVRRWQARAPLARFAVVLGAWCEGETRTGRPWPGVVRWYWHQAPYRLADWLAHELAPGSPWRLPWTATDAEWIEASSKSRCGAATQADATRRPVAVWSEGSDRGAAVAEACTALGWPVFLYDPRREQANPLLSAAALIVEWSRHPEWDRWDESSPPGRWIGQLPSLGLLGFPRRQDFQEATRRGLRLLAKPWRLADLRAWLESEANASPSRVSESMG